jgi:hypothetical protein
MTYKFLSQLPDDFSGQPVLISGNQSIDLAGQEFVMVEDNGREYVFEIRYAIRCSPFKEVCLLDAILGVGHQAHFYMFDLQTNTNLISIGLDGYFGHLYLSNKLFYVASAAKLYCIDRKGRIIWKNENLGIDGVVVEKFEDDVILGSGEWDPPNGWKDFKLSKSTGELIK